jgi:hypothetical protein
MMSRSLMMARFKNRSAWLLVPMLLALLSGQARAQPGDAPVSAALNVSALQPGKDAILAVVVDVPEGFHAQSHTPLDASLIKFEVKLDRSDAVVAREPVYPEPKLETYPALGKLSVYTDRVITYVPLAAKGDAKPGSLKLAGTVQLQLCDDQMCYGATIVEVLGGCGGRTDGSSGGAEPTGTVRRVQTGSHSTCRDAAEPHGVSPASAGGDVWSVQFAFGARFSPDCSLTSCPACCPCCR